MSFRSIERRMAVRLGLIGIATFPFASHAAAALEIGQQGPIGTLHAFNEALLLVMKAGQRAPFTQRFAMLAPAADSTFDVGSILRMAVGPPWLELPADQQAALQTAFRRYTVANFVANFDSYSGESFEVSPSTRTLPGGNELVTTRITSPGGSTTVIAYVMHQTPGGWKSLDVLLNGSISRVAIQRSDFRRLLQSGGGPALFMSLQNKVFALSGGALT
jgi:phospholipid transport system substrate-binding protein